MLPSDIPSEGREFHLLYRSVSDFGLDSVVLCTDEWMAKLIMDNQNDATSFKRLVSKLKVLCDSIFHPARVSPDQRIYPAHVSPDRRAQL